MCVYVTAAAGWFVTYLPRQMSASHLRFSRHCVIALHLKGCVNQNSKNGILKITISKIPINLKKFGQNKTIRGLHKSKQLIEMLKNNKIEKSFGDFFVFN